MCYLAEKANYEELVFKSIRGKMNKSRKVLINKKLLIDIKGG